jgi:hypothetical protein
VEPEITVLELKDKIWDREGIPTEYLLITFGGKLLMDERTLAYYGLKQESTIQWRVRFGPSKK